MSKQVFRLMGMPDKVIAFDELPEDMLKGFEMIRAEGFPKAWKNWMGLRDVTIKIPSELNPVTGVRRTFDPVTETDSYFYLVDWNLKPNVEKWKEVESYVRGRVSSEFRLKDKLEDMALPLAPDKTSGVTLEPDDVIVIPLPKEVKQNEPETFRCEEDGCSYECEKKQALAMHKVVKHKKEKVAA